MWGDRPDKTQPSCISTATKICVSLVALSHCKRFTKVCIKGHRFSKSTYLTYTCNLIAPSPSSLRHLLRFAGVGGQGEPNRGTAPGSREPSQGGRSWGWKAKYRYATGIRHSYIHSIPEAQKSAVQPSCRRKASSGLWSNAPYRPTWFSVFRLDINMSRHINPSPSTSVVVGILCLDRFALRAVDRCLGMGDMITELFPLTANTTSPFTFAVPKQQHPPHS
ncbi:hypothetical protein CH63R_12956 [Colletotrichum higginsianum IMI 349063]|uniref:Uncharacterized protein n=1 Tax=Colletotrichum higginsianum (strain IMI 349063) TaxID=759273 RepID=A0A1B7XVL8_COLHI|nr:hypothetical protein CH63R_12956 [Colletotrichum higginsianum IMI 349063]OBR03829.1 hypothetical protein CH63R_12956 [Colletotrichum higginsianum IMI 349063]